MWNVREVEVPTVIRYDIITFCSLSTLVLQHVLEVLNRMCNGCHYLLFAQIDNLHNVCHLTQRIVLSLLRCVFDDVSHVGKSERRGK